MYILGYDMSSHSQMRTEMLRDMYYNAQGYSQSGRVLGSGSVFGADEVNTL